MKSVVPFTLLLNVLSQRQKFLQYVKIPSLPLTHTLGYPLVSRTCKCLLSFELSPLVPSDVSLSYSNLKFMVTSPWTCKDPSSPGLVVVFDPLVALVIWSNRCVTYCKSTDESLTNPFLEVQSSTSVTCSIP